MPDSLKIAPLSDAAFRAYVTSICYAARSLTDGFIPIKKAKEFAGKPRIVQELVPTLWEVADGGFTVHDYLQYNPTRETVLTERGKAKDRMIAARSGYVRPNNDRTSGEVRLPRTPSPSRPKDPLPPAPPSLEELQRERPNIFLLYEQLLGRGVSPLIADRLKDYEQTHSQECIDHCFVEAAESNARSVKLLYQILDRHKSEGCHERKAVGRNGFATPQTGDAAAELARFNGGFRPEYVPDYGATDDGPASLAAADGEARLEVRR